MSDGSNSLDESIRKAMQEGCFDNLPGKGKPLNLEDHPYEHPDWRLAHHMLRANDFTLPWIANQQEIDRDLENLRQTLRNVWHSRQAQPDTHNAHLEKEWQRAVESFRAEAQALNHRIRDYNLSVPSSRFQRMAIRVELEIQRIMAE